MAAQGAVFVGPSPACIERMGHKTEARALAGRHGAVAHLFERDCSTQRRHQKVIEEAPGPALRRETALAMADRVAEMMRRIGYDSIGTVEMLLDAAGAFRFLETNTRLQVEHGVTEEVTGVDLVKAQLRLAAGEGLGEVLRQPPAVCGHAIQARVCAEDPRTFLPSPGRLEVFRPPAGGGVRVETGLAEGRVVTPHYDPLVAKVIARAETRTAAVDRLAEALAAFEIRGVKINIPALAAILGSEAFRAGRVHTGLIPEVLGTKTGDGRR